MRLLLVIAVGFGVGPCSAIAAFDPFEGPKPLAVFLQFDPWAMVLGSDTPRVVIYDNGHVIFTKRVDGVLIYHHVHLDHGALMEMQREWLPLLDQPDLEPLYNVVGEITDQPEAMFYLSDGGREVVSRVYGLAVPNAPVSATNSTQTEESATPGPLDQLIKLHDWFCHLDFPNSERWTPQYLEVMLWDYSYAPEPSIQWPADWPSLDSDRAIKRGGDGKYEAVSVFLDGSMHSQVRQFLSTQNERGAVEVHGKKWSAAYRFTFPSETVWRRAFSAAAERYAATAAVSSSSNSSGEISFRLGVGLVVLFIVLAAVAALTLRRKRLGSAPRDGQ